MYCAVIKEDNMKKSLKKILAFTMAAAMAATGGRMTPTMGVFTGMTR